MERREHDRAEELLHRRVLLRDLALAFDETVASSVEVHVEGRNFYPPILGDISSATSSIHINQFGFRPGSIGDEFADALVSKAADGIPVRLVIDRQGSDPDRASRAFYERLLTAGVDVRVVRAAQARGPVQPTAAGGTTRWNLDRLGHIDHRKLVVVDGRIGWVGGAGIEDHFYDGRFHDLFLRVTGPVVSQLQLVFVATFRWLEGAIQAESLDDLFPEFEHEPRSVPATVLHNAPGAYRPITQAIAHLFDNAKETLDVVNPYVTDRRMIERIARAAQRGAQVRLFVPANANNWACAAAQRHHHRALLDAGVRILEYPTMLHAKAFVRDGEDLLAGTCNLEAWSLRRFFEIDLLVRSREVATQFDERFSTPAEVVSAPGYALVGARERLKSRAFAIISPLL
ncbi:MAG TPA: phosphatidylserine/phosphatidylglycerophosphate/cardiolipin synthase family protein [Gaiellaceae bacterium]|nr:phosphatidylserine/phosphatidylglycerophosphate/cardiolipin synthase family protein [Gaiellaceae bacterium]